MAKKDLPASEKVALMELDYLSVQRTWFNYGPGTWYVSFSMLYPNIGVDFLNGITGQPITAIGSMLIDGIAATGVASAADVMSTPNSWYFDAVPRTLYVHATDGNPPELHVISMGVTYGCADSPQNLNSIYYEPRLLSIPTLTKSKDPLFFGRIACDGGSVGLKNADGLFDLLAEDGAALFGATIRFLQGFAGDAYAAYELLGSSQVQNVGVSQEEFTVHFIDRRAFLCAKAPSRVFDATTYPNIKTDNIGKAIPLAYGTINNMQVMCIDEDAAAPASYNFKICDVADHANGIQAIDHVYVDGALVAPTSSSLPNATFVLSSANFKPGQTVTADVRGYKDGAATFMTCATDIILDLLLTYYGMTYIAANFNTTEWAAARTLQVAAFPGGIGLVVDSAAEVWSIVEDICASTLLNLIPEDAGTYTLRMQDAARATDQVFTEALSPISVEYDVSQVIDTVTVGWGKNWAGDSYRHVEDTSRSAAIYGTFHVHREGKFETLLTTAADALTFSGLMLDICGTAISRASVEFKMEPLGRELMDYVQVPLLRANGTVRNVVMEIQSISKVPSSGISLEGRIMRAA